MKFSLVAIAATLAVANAADCDTTKLRPLLANSDVATCTTESGFSFVPPSKPTAETLPKVCASTACKNVLAAVKALELGDCTLLGLQLQADLLTPLTTACSGSSASSTTAAKSSGSRAGSGAGNATVTAPKATAAASKTNASTSSNSSSASANTVNTPAATTTPAPTTSAASSLVVATSAAVLAVASAMLL